jgi:hypothetical protein
VSNYLKPIDCNGTVLNVGDSVVLLRVPDSLLQGLPGEDQSAIKSEVGSNWEVISFEDSGLVEIQCEYQSPDADVAYRTIWIAPECLKKNASQN